MDVFSKSDPICILFCKDDFGGAGWFEFGRTEVIDNNLNPDFVKKFTLSYFFEERQHLKFMLYDIDSNSRDLSQHDFLGEFECTLGEIVSASKLERKLIGPKPDSGSIILTAEELSTCKEEVTLQFNGRKLDKKDWFGKSDPFLAFYKVNEDGSYTVAHRTEVIKNTLNPTWKPFSLPVRVLCGGDYDRSILVRCIDWNRDGSEDLIGEFTTSMTELVKGPGPVNTYELENPKKRLSNKKKAYKASGTVELLKYQTAKIYSFLDFVTGGTELNCTIAIDFTASNGNPQSPTSLHYINPVQPNQYARALQAVGEIIQDYDSDQLFPVLGFGARLPPDGRISHEFFVNGSTSNPFCTGIPGVMEAYHRCITQVQLYGPTNFSPVINHVARFAAAKRDGSEYFILLIITDGVITDMAQTKEAIVAASVLPLSIIIVGVGSADFTAMEELDGDDEGEFGRLRSPRGKYAERDIVQFVPFSKFVQGHSASDVRISQARLAKEVLEEIPDQFLSYMKRNGIKPGRGQRSGSQRVSLNPSSPINPAFGPGPTPQGARANGGTDAPPPYPGF
jgi:hypothetical protein